MPINLDNTCQQPNNAADTNHHDDSPPGGRWSGAGGRGAVDAAGLPALPATGVQRGCASVDTAVARPAQVQLPGGAVRPGGPGAQRPGDVHEEEAEQRGRRRHPEAVRHHRLEKSDAPDAGQFRACQRRHLTRVLLIQAIEFFLYLVLTPKLKEVKSPVTSIGDSS